MTEKIYLKAKLLHIETGGINICVLNKEQAEDLDINHLDRVMLKYNNKKIIASVDLTRFAVKKGEIGLFVEVQERLNIKSGEKLIIESVSKPKSLNAIRSKLNGEELNEEEINDIVNDIVNDALTDVELTAFITGSFCNGMSMEETYNLTKAMVNTGEVIKVGEGDVYDKHSIGGVPGNRVTMLLIPILSSVGIKIPKTSSRAITSPSGTADTVEVLCPVTLSKKKILKVIRECNGCMVWGGSFNLAPADDKIIKIEKPLSIDAEGQMLASIMAKKISVGSNHIFIDLPMGPGTKVPTQERADQLKEAFTILGKKLGVYVECIESNGSQPCGNGIGPALEAIDVIKILTNKDDAPMDLRNKAVMFAGRMLEAAKKARKGNGEALANEIINSGKAWSQFKKIIKAQGGNPNIKISNIKVGNYSFNVKSKEKGIITMINNKIISQCARSAGAPFNKGAGIFIKVKLSDVVKKGDVLMTIYAETEEKLNRAKEVTRHNKIFKIQQ